LRVDRADDWECCGGPRAALPGVDDLDGPRRRRAPQRYPRTGGVAPAGPMVEIAVTGWKRWSETRIEGMIFRDAVRRDCAIFGRLATTLSSARSGTPAAC